MNKKEADTIKYLKRFRKILFITTSNRWPGERIPAKSTQLAKFLAEKLGKRVRIIDATKLRIYPCEGNVSSSKGNVCGVFKANLKDKKKNPSGCHRCWASINNKDDELWKITRELLESEVVVFFSSVRWGTINSIHQKLLERLTFLENRHSTLGEENVLKDIKTGTILIGQNWKGAETLKRQRQILNFFGFQTPKQLFWNWQFTKNFKDESNESYIRAARVFDEDFLK